MVSDEGTVVSAEDSHNHQPNPGDVQARQLRGSMRRRARDEGTVVSAEDSHIHQPNPGDVQARQLRGNMRKRARDETTSGDLRPGKVKLLQQSSTTMTSPAETASALPKYQRVQYRERRKRFPSVRPWSDAATCVWSPALHSSPQPREGKVCITRIHHQSSTHHAGL